MFGKDSPQVQNDGKKGRSKVGVAPGHSMMDWIRYHNSASVSRRTPVKLSELRKHCTETDCWTAIRGKVYDITNYLDYHPGGKPELMRGAGCDSTALFDQTHRWVNVESMLHNLLLGPLIIDRPPLNKNKTKRSVPSVPTFLGDPSMNTHETVVIPVQAKPNSQLKVKQLAPARKAKSSFSVWTVTDPPLVVTHDCKVIRLSPSDPSSLTWKYWLQDVPIGGHVRLKLTQREQARTNITIKPYTPIAVDPVGKTLTLLVKAYPAPEGLMSRALCSMDAKDAVQVSNPLPPGCDVMSLVTSCSTLVLVYAGTGITPHLRILIYFLEQIEKTTSDNWAVEVIACNKTARDQVFHNEWCQLSEIALQGTASDCLAAARSVCDYTRLSGKVFSDEQKNLMTPSSNSRLRLHTCLSHQDDYDGYKGRLSGEMVGEMLPLNRVTRDTASVFICGPAGFNAVARQAVLECGFPDENIGVFQ